MPTGQPCFKGAEITYDHMHGCLNAFIYFFFLFSAFLSKWQSFILYIIPLLYLLTTGLSSWPYIFRIMILLLKRYQCDSFSNRKIAESVMIPRYITFTEHCNQDTCPPTRMAASPYEENNILWLSHQSKPLFRMRYVCLCSWISC